MRSVSLGSVYFLTRVSWDRATRRPGTVCRIGAVLCVFRRAVAVKFGVAAHPAVPNLMSASEATTSGWSRSYPSESECLWPHPGGLCHGAPPRYSTRPRAPHHAAPRGAKATGGAIHTSARRRFTPALPPIRGVRQCFAAPPPGARCRTGDRCRGGSGHPAQRAWCGIAASVFSYPRPAFQYRTVAHSENSIHTDDYRGRYRCRCVAGQAMRLTVLRGLLRALPFGRCHDADHHGGGDDGEEGAGG